MFICAAEYPINFPIVSYSLPPIEFKQCANSACSSRTSWSEGASSSFVYFAVMLPSIWPDSLILPNDPRPDGCQFGLARPQASLSGRLTNDAALGLFDKLDDLIDFRVGGQLGSDCFDCLTRVVFGAIDQAKRLFDPLHALGWKSAPFQANEIDAAHLRWIPIRDH